MVRWVYWVNVNSVWIMFTYKNTKSLFSSIIKHYCETYQLSHEIICLVNLLSVFETSWSHIEFRLDPVNLFLNIQLTLLWVISQTHIITGWYHRIILLQGDITYSYCYSMISQTHIVTRWYHRLVLLQDHCFRVMS